MGGRVVELFTICCLMTDYVANCLHDVRLLYIC